MESKEKYRYLKPRPDKSTRELFVGDTGIRASTMWHDRYINLLHPKDISADRNIPLEAVYEALEYCLEHWEDICREKDEERAYLTKMGFFEQQAAADEDLPG